MKKGVLVLGISTFLGIAYGVECEYYKVQKGDTLDGIAKRKGVSVQEILKNNKHIAPKKLKAGDKICIPVAEKPKAKKEAKAKKEQDYEYYTVQKGARLKDIANKLGVPLKELEALNPGYKNKFLAKGTKVKVPKTAVQKQKEKEEKIEYDIYTIKRGGRLKDVAKSLGIPLKELEVLNPEYKNKFLSKGTKIKVPKASISEEEKKTKRYVMHKVRKGETLSSIAKRYGVSEAEIIKINHLKGKKLVSGEYIKIPVAVKEPQEQKPKISFSEKNLEHIPKEREEEKGREKEREKEREEMPTPTEIKISKRSISMPVEGKVVKSTRGVDIIAKCGEPVLSVDDGKVIYSGGDLQAYGNMVIIEHRDFISLYAYNSKNMVKRGDTVSRGQEIAIVGKKNNSDECMLHFELRTKDGVPLDPTEYLKNTQ